jgi:hypothetical protein
VYREGLARFASSPYSTEDEHLKDAYRHLTNYSINKKAKNFVENQQASQDNVGHKWSFSALNRHLQHVGINVELVWSRILDVILKTLISARTAIATETRKATVHSTNCFELYGFDILVDEKLKPWLVEVNLSPSMVAESPLDLQVKGAVLSDTFNLVNVGNAGFRAVATAKLRSQLLQMRHSIAVASENAEAFRRLETARMQNEALKEKTNGPGTDDGKVRLADLSERDLKMIAQGLREVVRCNNFIRLYPTRKAVKKYGPLMRDSSPASKMLLRLLLGDDVAIPADSDADIGTLDLADEDLTPIKQAVGQTSQREQSQRNIPKVLLREQRSDLSSQQLSPAPLRSSPKASPKATKSSSTGTLPSIFSGYPRHLPGTRSTPALAALANLATHSKPKLPMATTFNFATKSLPPLAASPPSLGTLASLRPMKFEQQIRVNDLFADIEF